MTNFFKRLLFLIILSPVLSGSTPVLIEDPYVDVRLRGGEIEKLGSWKFPPDIQICEGSPAARAEVAAAVEWWKTRGYTFGNIVEAGHGNGCIVGSAYGSIVISLISQENFNPSNHATTFIRFDRETGEIVRVRIELKENLRERILEHEIGHALGWLHINRRGHLMHPILENGGWNDEGLVQNL